MQKINLGNVGWRAVLARLDDMFPDPDGTETASATLDQLARNSNETIDELARLREELRSRPFA